MTKQLHADLVENLRFLIGKQSGEPGVTRVPTSAVQQCIDALSALHPEAAAISTTEHVFINTRPEAAGQGEAVKAYLAENAERRWTGRAFGFDGGGLNLDRNGNAEFVFDMDELEPYYEEGKSLMLAKVPASEIEALRDYFVAAFPATPRPVPVAPDIVPGHADLFERARKRADEFPVLTSLPPQEHPDAKLLRELADALSTPIAAHGAGAVTEANGYIIANGDGTKWRTLDQGLPVWTEDREKAIRYARRADADLAAEEDEDAWLIQPVTALRPDEAAGQGEAVTLPEIPDDDADFTPDLARKIIAMYQKMLATPRPEASDAPGIVEREVAWLIERKWSLDSIAGATEPRWYAENASGDHSWTRHPGEAKRFSTKAEAEAFPSYQMIAGDPAISITEHVWINDGFSWSHGRARATPRPEAPVAPDIVPLRRFKMATWRDIDDTCDMTDMVEDSFGKWVRHKDHAEALAALSSELAEAKREIERLTPLAVAYDYLESPAGREMAEARAEAAEAEVARLKDGIEQALKNVAYKAGDHPIVPIKYNAFEAAIRSLTAAAKGG